MHVDLKTSGYKLSRLDRERLDAAIEHLDKLTDTYQHRALHVTIEKFGHTEECQVRMVLTLSRRRLVASDTGPAAAPVLQMCVDILVRKIGLAKERVHRSHGERQVRRAKMEAASPDIDAARTARGAGDYEAFKNALSEVDGAVEAEIGRRLKFHPDAEALLADEFVIADLVENTMLLAFSSFEARPENVPFRDWMFSLIDPAIDDVVRTVQTRGEEREPRPTDAAAGEAA